MLRSGPLLVPLAWDFPRAGLCVRPTEVQSGASSSDRGFQGQVRSPSSTGGSPELSHRPSTLSQSRGWIQPPLTGCLPSVRPRSTPASAARLLCLMALQSRSPPCPHTAPASHHQAPSKSTAQPALARAPSGSHPQRSTPASALRRGLRAVPGASSRAAMCLSTHISDISMRMSSLSPRPGGSPSHLFPPAFPGPPVPGGPFILLPPGCSSAKEHMQSGRSGFTSWLSNPHSLCDLRP